MHNLSDKNCVDCMRSFRPRSGAQKRCDDCRAFRRSNNSSRRHDSRADVSAETLDRLGRQLASEPDRIGPAQLADRVTAAAAARRAGDRRGLAEALIQAASAAVILADRPERIALPAPVAVPTAA